MNPNQTALLLKPHPNAGKLVKIKSWSRATQSYTVTVVGDGPEFANVAIDAIACTTALDFARVQKRLSHELSVYAMQRTPDRAGRLAGATPDAIESEAAICPAVTHVEVCAQGYELRLSDADSKVVALLMPLSSKPDLDELHTVRLPDVGERVPLVGIDPTVDFFAVHIGTSDRVLYFSNQTPSFHMTYDHMETLVGEGYIDAVATNTQELFAFFKLEEKVYECAYTPGDPYLIFTRGGKSVAKIVAFDVLAPAQYRVVCECPATPYRLKTLLRASVVEEPPPSQKYEPHRVYPLGSSVRYKTRRHRVLLSPDRTGKMILADVGLVHASDVEQDPIDFVFAQLMCAVCFFEYFYMRYKLESAHDAGLPPALKTLQRLTHTALTVFLKRVDDEEDILRIVERNSFQTGVYLLSIPLMTYIYNSDDETDALMSNVEAIACVVDTMMHANVRFEFDDPHILCAWVGDGRCRYRMRIVNMSGQPLSMAQRVYALERAAPMRLTALLSSERAAGPDDESNSAENDAVAHERAQRIGDALIREEEEEKRRALVTKVRTTKKKNKKKKKTAPSDSGTGAASEPPNPNDSSRGSEGEGDDVGAYDSADGDDEKGARRSGRDGDGGEGGGEAPCVAAVVAENPTSCGGDEAVHHQAPVTTPLGKLRARAAAAGTKTPIVLHKKLSEAAEAAEVLEHSLPRADSTVVEPEERTRLAEEQLRSRTTEVHDWRACVGAARRAMLALLLTQLRFYVKNVAHMRVAHNALSIDFLKTSAIAAMNIVRSYLCLVAPEETATSEDDVFRHLVAMFPDDVTLSEDNPRHLVLR